MPILPTGTSTNRSGFTLVELLVVVVILSLISFISLPLLANRGDGDEKLMVRRIAGTIKQLYNEATLTRDEHLLMYDFSRNSLQAYRLQSNAGVIEKKAIGRELNLAPLQMKQVNIEGKGTFRTGQVFTRIFPLGWMEATRLFLAKQGGGEVQLLFSPLTGSVTIDDKQTTVQ